MLAQGGSALVTERLALAQESRGTEEQRVACTNAWEIRKH
jgi:hypothetical protein